MNQRGPFRIVSSKIVYKNPWITVHEDQVVRPGNKEGIFGWIEKLSGSSVLPIDDSGKVLLAREFKYGVNRESIEAISGGCDAGELPLRTAQRELEEEAGLLADEWVDLGVVDPFTTIVSSPNHMFIAKKLRKGTPKHDLGEAITVVKMSLKEARDMVLTGKITHAATCVLVLKAARLEEM